MPAMNRVLMTGAAGGIGRAFRPMLQGAYPLLRLSDIADIDKAGPGEEIVRGDLESPADVARMLEGVDGVIHLGGLAVEHPWERILPVNIAGLYDFYLAAVEAGVSRIVFASSNHAIGFYHRGRRLGADDPPRPDSRYGLSKAFGELCGQYFADNYGLGVLSVRIGSCFDNVDNKRFLSTWLSRRDFVQLCRIGLEHPNLHHEIVWGVSANDRGWWDNEPAFRLGYRPEDNAEDHLEEALAGEAGRTNVDPLGERLQGGAFGSTEYRGDPKRVLEH